VNGCLEKSGIHRIGHSLRRGFACVDDVPYSRKSKKNERIKKMPGDEVRCRTVR
jgi:hypothetical protein